MNIRTMTVFSCLAAVAATAFGATSVTTTSKWSGTAGTTPATAGDWNEPGNWDNGQVPNGTTFEADVTTLPQGTFVDFGEAITLGRLTGPQCSMLSTYTGGYVIGGTLTFENSGYDYNIAGGALYCDVSVAEGQNDGFLNQTTLAGRIRFRDRTFILASAMSFHRLDLYATSSSELRTDDVQIGEMYCGSGTYVAVGPHAAETHAEAWTVTPGSPFLTRAADGVQKAAGAVVTADAFPAGTFVKRIFNKRMIELSQPADANATAGEQTLNFAAHRPRTVVTIPVMRLVSSGALYKTFQKPVGSGDFRVEIGRLLANNVENIQFVTDNNLGASYEPATVVIHDAAPGNAPYSYPERIMMPLATCHIEFAETGREGARSGLPVGAMTSHGGGNAWVSTLTVTNGISASVGLVTNLVSTIVKDGAGLLELGLTNDVARNTGCLDIREGTIELPAGAWVKKVAIAAGATLRINGDFEPTTLEAADGARIEGAGTLLVEDASVARSLVCADTVTLKFRKNMEKPIRDPVFEVTGDPAFWVDATNRATMTFRNGDGVNVTRLNDIRKRSDDDGYMFATNLAVCPQMMQINGIDRGIYFDRAAPSSCDPALVQELFWSKPITNIHAIFQVVDVRGGGGQFLGFSKRLYDLLGRANDFTRDVNASWNNDIFYRGNSGVYQKALTEGDIIINGDRMTFPCGYLHTGGGANLNIGGSTETFAPQVCEVVPTLPVAADTFSYDWAGGSIVGRNGRKLLCELIVYTNALTRAERVRIAGYLAKKWVGCEVSYDEIGADALDEVDVASAQAFAADEGRVVTVGRVVGTGTMVKKGAGDLCVDALPANGTVGLTVEGGTLELRTASEAPTSIAELPAGAWCHMDASDTTKYTYNADTKLLTSGWASSVGSETWYGYNKTPAVTTHPSCGLSMFDLGAPKLASADNTGRAFSFTKNNNIRTMFMVQDATQGGTTLFGNSVTYSYEGAMRGNWKTRWYDHVGEACFLVSDPLISTEFTFGVSDVWKKSRIRLNGVRVDPTTTGYTGNGVIDIVSAVGYNRMSTDRFAYNNGHGQYLGGGLLGEYILYERALSQREVRRVEAYLAKKWGKALPAEFVQTKAGAVRLANGATLRLAGETALKAASLGGAGTIQGSVEFGDAFVAVVNGDGSVGRIDVTGGVASAGGTVTLAGAVQALRPGTYRILNAASAAVGAWTFAPPPGYAASYAFHVGTDANGVFLTVSRKGTTILFR